MQYKRKVKFKKVVQIFGEPQYKEYLNQGSKLNSRRFLGRPLYFQNLSGGPNRGNPGPRKTTSGKNRENSQPSSRKFSGQKNARKFPLQLQRNKKHTNLPWWAYATPVFSTG
jgi:hypothetical protein